MDLLKAMSVFHLQLLHERSSAFGKFLYKLLGIIPTAHWGNPPEGRGSGGVLPSNGILLAVRKHTGTLSKHAGHLPSHVRLH